MTDRLRPLRPLRPLRSLHQGPVPSSDCPQEARYERSCVISGSSGSSRFPASRSSGTCGQDTSLSTATCACSDSGQQIWFTAWPAHALLHGLNPFYSRAVWAPKGTNLLVNASSPLIGLLLAPLTWAFGPVASTNIALTLAPGLSAWGCFMACRRIVTWRWAALVGALLFGYSPFVISSIRQGHLGLGLLVLPPLMLAWLDEIFAKQQRPAWMSGLVLGLLVAAQFLISPEVLVMTVVVAAIGIFVAAILAGISWFREHFLHALRALGVATGISAALLAAPAWFALDGPGHIVGSVWPGLNYFGNKLNDIWAPDSPASDASAGAFSPYGHTLANLGLTGPNPAYLGYGAIAAAALAIVVAWRRKTSLALACAAIGSLVLSLGGTGFRDDILRSFTWLPWQSVFQWPVLDDVLPTRFALFTELAAAVLVAIGIDGARRRFLVRDDPRPASMVTARHAAAWAKGPAARAGRTAGAVVRRGGVGSGPNLGALLHPDGNRDGGAPPLVLHGRSSGAHRIRGLVLPVPGICVARVRADDLAGGRRHALQPRGGIREDTGPRWPAVHDRSQRIRHELPDHADAVQTDSGAVVGPDIRRLEGAQRCARHVEDLLHRDHRYRSEPRLHGCSDDRGERTRPERLR